jgi:wyosine [tRNA(Phe)-imidazoG37] synthetase (radical SAM superfamily)
MNQPIENKSDETRIWDLNCPIVYGPVPSRRLGFSLGINLLPMDQKHCNFVCLYCQCGWTERQMLELPLHSVGFPSLRGLERAVREEFERFRQLNIIPDTIIFSGNGEPTLYPEFDRAVEIVKTARDCFLPESMLGILTNGTLLGNEIVFQAMVNLDLKCLKLDAGNLWMDRPCTPYRLEELIPIWRKVPELIIQSFFCEGQFDNTAPEWVELWLDQLEAIQPSQLHIYTLDRKAPVPTIEKASPKKLHEIAGLVQSRLDFEPKVFI